LAHGILGFYFWQQVLYIQQYILDEAWGAGRMVLVCTYEAHGFYTEERFFAFKQRG
jgi:hypothetical protein